MRVFMPLVLAVILVLSPTAFAADAQDLLRQAQELRDSDKREAAAVKQRDAVDLLRRGGDWPAWRDAHLQLVYDLILLRDNSDALTEAEAVLKEARRRQDVWAQSSVLRYQGEIHLGVNAFADAETAYQGALDAARAGRLRDLEGEALVSRGDLRRRQRRADDGRKDLDRAVALFDAEGLPTAAAEARFRIGSLELERGRPHVAEPILRQVLQAGSAAARVTLANAHHCLGMIDLDRGDRGAAREQFEAAATTYRSLGAPLGQANVARDLGHLELAAGNAAAAKQLFGDAEILYRRVGDTVWEAEAKAKREEAERVLAAGKTVVVAPPPPSPPAPVITPILPEPAPGPSWLDALRKFFEDKAGEIIGIAVGTMVVGLLTVWWKRKES